ncbi:MAG: O-antigen ligase family protein [Melioribacteraceae bacterium]|nr:O-antigen ligase family protein [Melioribacteraceae bacterium]
MQIDYRRITTILFLFILFPLISLIYSRNIEFGMMKIAYIVFGIIPSIIVFIYFLNTINRDRIKIFLSTILLLGLLFGLVSLILSPYNPSTSYSFEYYRWSHVIGGRFLSSITVIVLLLHFSNFIKSKTILIATTTILLVSVYFVGLRAAFLGIIILISFLILFAIIRKEKKSLKLLILSLLISTLSVFSISQFNNLSTNRYSKLQVNESGKFDDGAITARLIAYEVSWENIKKHPMFGVGFGGFYNEKISGDIAQIKYPHNLLIEIQLELGIMGSIFFAGLFGLIFWKSYKFSIPLFIFLLFSFWLAMFSKDIATQTQLWIGIAVLCFDSAQHKMIERGRHLMIL